MSCEDPDSRNPIHSAQLEKARFQELDVTSDQQKDNAGVVDHSHLAASSQMAKSTIFEVSLVIPDERIGSSWGFFSCHTYERSSGHRKDNRALAYMPSSTCSIHLQGWVNSSSTPSVSPESVLAGLGHSRLNPLDHLPQLSLSIAFLFKIDNEISLFQNLLLTLPRPHPLRSKCLRISAILRLSRYEFSDEGEDLNKSIYHSTEAIFLPFCTPIELGSFVIVALLYLANALLLRSRHLKQPSDVKHAITYLRYLQDQSLETSDLTRSDIKAFFVWAFAVQVELESVDPRRDIGEMATLCLELLRSSVEESLLIKAVNALADAISGTTVPFGQSLPDRAIECLREARIRFPDLDAVRCPLAASLFVRFCWAPTHDDYEEAMPILDEIIADPNGNVIWAMEDARQLARGRCAFDSKPEHLAEAIFRTRTLLDAMSSEDPHRRSVMNDLADLEKERFEEFGVGSSRQEDIPELPMSRIWLRLPNS
ncbi:hypothetical protein BJV74DRAFT_888456 [Russula compacta]|nr:hypothetical protein BJV74DRAFT_888456 [Russula compacta]